jgi:uncharacterized DUF497 family protein
MPAEPGPNAGGGVRIFFVHPVENSDFVYTMYLVRFDWDEMNRLKVEAHGVSTNEYEQAFLRRHVAEQKLVALERRKIAVGKTEAGRVLILIYTIRRGKVRPITAYESRKARAKWQAKL